MKTLRLTFSVAALLIASTAAYGAGIPLSPPGVQPEPASFTATGQVIQGWYYGASAGYASSVFAVVYNPADLTELIIGTPVFYRDGDPAAQPPPGTQATLIDATSSGFTIDGSGSDPAWTVVFGLNVWLDGSGNGGAETPDYIFYSQTAIHNPGNALSSLLPQGLLAPALDAGVRAYAADWGPPNTTPPHEIPGSSFSPPLSAIYVGFEDQMDSIPPDFDYNDHQFVFHGLVGTPTQQEIVPEPSTWAMMITGIAGLGLGVWRRRRNANLS